MPEQEQEEEPNIRLTRGEPIFRAHGGSVDSVIIPGREKKAWDAGASDDDPDRDENGQHVEDDRNSQDDQDVGVRERPDCGLLGPGHYLHFIPGRAALREWGQPCRLISVDGDFITLTDPDGQELVVRHHDPSLLVDLLRHKERPLVYLHPSEYLHQSKVLRVGESLLHVCTDQSGWVDCYRPDFSVSASGGPSRQP